MTDTNYGPSVEEFWWARLILRLERLRSVIGDERFERALRSVVRTGHPYRRGASLEKYKKWLRVPRAPRFGIQRDLEALADRLERKDAL